MPRQNTPAQVATDSRHTIVKMIQAMVRANKKAELPFPYMIESSLLLAKIKQIPVTAKVTPGGIPYKR